MNTTKKIAVVLAVLMVAAAMAAPAVMGDNPTYIVTVKNGQSTTTTVINAGFGEVRQNTAETISSSLTLTNVGDWNAGVKAKCENQSLHGGATEYGLIGSTDTASVAVYIGGNKLKLGKTGSLEALRNDGADATIDDGSGPNKVPAGNSVNYDAELTVPGAQTVDSYSGLVTITFTNA